MARDYKAEAKYMKKVFRKIPKLPKDIDQWVRNNPLRDSKYLFCYREKGIRYGYCTHCGKTSQLDGFKHYKNHDTVINAKHRHNEWGYCHKCKSKVQFKDAGRGRGKLYDYSKFIIILKKDNGIFLRFFDVARDYCYEYKDVETEYTEEYRAFFCDGKTTMWKQSFSYDYCPPQGISPRTYSDSWEQMSKISEGKNYSGCMIYKEDRLYDDVFKGTPFEYSMFSEYRKQSNNSYQNYPPVRYLEKTCKYRAIEQLTKIGFTKLINDYVKGWNTPKVNWRGKNPQKVLGLTKAEIQKLAKINPDTEQFNLYKFFSQKVKGLTIDERTKYMEVYSFYNVENIPLQVPPQIKLSKVFRYIDEQVDSGNYDYHPYALGDWTDYIRNCKKLNYNLKDKSIVFPKDLKKMHDRVYKLIEISKNEKADKKIRAMYLKKLKRYEYKEEKYFITVASCAADLIEEGQKMHHCVATYIDRVAENECTILFLRSTAQPDKPLVTCEVRGNKPIQIRAKNNAVPSQDVMDFWERFKKKKLNNKAEKSKSRKVG
jgi:hypothetical protein